MTSLLGTVNLQSRLQPARSRGEHQKESFLPLLVYLSISAQRAEPLSRLGKRPWGILWGFHGPETFATLYFLCFQVSHPYFENPSVTYQAGHVCCAFARLCYIRKSREHAFSASVLEPFFLKFPKFLDFLGRFFFMSFLWFEDKFALVSVFVSTGFVTI